MSTSKTHTTIKNFGNTSGASIIITLADAYKHKKLKKGDLIALVGFGGGLSYGATLLTWVKWMYKRSQENNSLNWINKIGYDWIKKYCRKFFILTFIQKKCAYEKT